MDLNTICSNQQQILYLLAAKVDGCARKYATNQMKETDWIKIEDLLQKTKI